MPMMRAGMRRRIGKARNMRNGRGIFEKSSSFLSSGWTTLLWAATWNFWVMRVGNSRRFWTCRSALDSNVAFCATQYRSKNVCGGDGVLNGEIDADAADRRHGVRAIADAQQAGTRPFAQAIDANAERLMSFQSASSATRSLRYGATSAMSARNAGRPRRCTSSIGAFEDDPRALPVVAAIDGDQHFSGLQIAERIDGIIGAARHAHPQHVDRRARSST